MIQARINFTIFSPFWEILRQDALENKINNQKRS